MTENIGKILEQNFWKMYLGVPTDYRFSVFDLLDIESFSLQRIPGEMQRVLRNAIRNTMTEAE